MNGTDADKWYMRQAIALANDAGKQGDLPFGSVIVHPKGGIIGRGSNVLERLKQINGHAEVLAMVKAQATMNARTLPDCTIYTTVEPCPGCAFMIRELKLARVVYGIGSPVMGGHTKFGILTDEDLTRKVDDYFGPIPEIVTGVLRHECLKSWQFYAPRLWKVFQEKGVLR